MKKYLEIIFGIILFLLIVVFFLRLILPREIDDVSPGIQCEQKYLEKADTLWVIPHYKSQPISENKAWCNYILNLNKKIGLHGIDHDYKEFQIDNITQEKLNYSIEIFEKCFNKTPTEFKAPQLMLSKNNKILLEKNHFKIKGNLNQIIHKVYHCSDTGTLPNYMHDLL